MDVLSNRTELIAEMFKAYVTNNELEPTQLQNVVAAMIPTSQRQPSPP